MANITFVSIYDRNAYGLRLMSANLKKQGHQCSIIFLKRYDSNPTLKLELEEGEYPWMGINKRGRTFKYASNSHISQRELDLLGETIRDIQPDILGLTVTTPLRTQAKLVTRYLNQQFDVPVIWGGFDPTVNTEDCLELCDYCSLGESDQTILDIAARIDRNEGFEDVPNLAFKRNGAKVVNDKHPVEQDLDAYPWRDNSPEDKYFIEDDRVVAGYERVNDMADGIYQAMSARGCPYKCTYCCEATFKAMYEGEKFLRRRSAKDFVSELAQAKQQFGLTKIHFEDEIFAMGLKWLREFVPLYKEAVDLPFTAYIYPVRSVEEILRLLKSAGLDYCCLALETGSERISKEVFDRVYDRALFLKTSRICKSLDIAFYTDVITFNPYEEEEDLKKTLDVLIEIGGNFDLCVNRLFVLPGTALAVKMEHDGKTTGDSTRDALFEYYCRLYWITSFTGRARTIVNLIESARIFRRYPKLLNPVVVEALVNPVSSLRALVRYHLPRPLREKVQEMKARTRARRTKRLPQEQPSSS